MSKNKLSRMVYNVVEGDSSADVYIYGSIPDLDNDWNYINEARTFVQDFKALEDKFETINIRINSPGGLVWDGLAMYNTIKNSKAKTYTFNEGMAGSIAAIILMAGNAGVHANKASLMLLHNASGMAIGNARDMIEMANILQEHDDVLAQIIADRSGMDLAEVKNRWFGYEDKVMSSEKAVELKLIDSIIDVKADVPDGAEAMTATQVVAEYEKGDYSRMANLHKRVSIIKILTNNESI
jgi:ATP-dependent Clp protease, protease subunit